MGALGINHDVNNELNNNLRCLVQCKSNSTSIFNPYVVIEPFIVLKYIYSFTYMVHMLQQNVHFLIIINI